MLKRAFSLTYHSFKISCKKCTRLKGGQAPRAPSGYAPVLRTASQRAQTLHEPNRTNTPVIICILSEKMYVDN